MANRVEAPHQIKSVLLDVSRSGCEIVQKLKPALNRRPTIFHLARMKSAARCKHCE
jgi:hypothetical protein